MPARNSLFPRFGYLFAPCVHLSAHCVFLFTPCEQKTFRVSHIFITFINQLFYLFRTTSLYGPTSA